VSMSRLAARRLLHDRQPLLDHRHRSPGSCSGLRIPQVPSWRKRWSQSLFGTMLGSLVVVDTWLGLTL
jgi:hypothetical protein